MIRRLSRPTHLSLLAAAAAAGCVTGTRTATVQLPSSMDTTPPVAKVPAPTPPTLVPGVRLAPLDTDVVPPLRATPLIAWGAAPAGTLHAPPSRQFDLRHQSVRVRFDWARHAVVGSTTLRLAALETPLPAARVNAVGMHIRSVTGTGASPLRYEYDDSVLTIHFARPLAPRAETSVTIDYESVRPKKGAYFIDRNHYLWTQGETQDTRYWLPTYDHPDDKTTWDIAVTTAPDERALSNGRLVSSRRTATGVVWTWAQEKPASTYLMSVVTGRYTVVRDRWRDVPVEYWTYPDSVAAARLGFGRTPDAIDVYSRKTGVAFPWAKYAQSVVPDFIFGGMENVSATTQNDDGILHPRWAEPQRNADGLMAHELGHQWYGDLLTTRDWSHAWLNEGFATFMEQIYREESKGVDEGAWDRLAAQAAVVDADRRNRRPIVYARYRKDPLELFFSGHIYPKGATVLQLLRHQLGDASFWRAMHRYTVDHAYGNVVTSDLQHAFEQSTGRSFETFFRQWIYGAGFPVFQVSQAYDPRDRRLVLTAREVQPRDSMTGWFDVDVDVSVLTDDGAARGTMPVRNGAGTVAITLPARPRSIDFNAGKWVLALTDFPRSTAMLDYQLLYARDVTAREDAIEQLRERTGQPAAARALATAAVRDRFWGVRQFAVQTLERFASDSAARAAAGVALRDPDARVRQAAAVTLSHFPGGTTPALLAAAAEHDASLIVRGVAVASYLVVAGEAGLPLADRVMAQPSWENVLRAPALAVLRTMPGSAARSLHHKYQP